MSVVCRLVKEAMSSASSFGAVVSVPVSASARRFNRAALLGPNGW